jgi:cold-inducible RNA-binding protein
VNKKLYVGNLPYTTTEDQLQELFSQAGEIAQVIVIKDRDTGRSKGFGFVEMETEAGAEEAIKRFNGYSINNRPLTVNEARPREERPNGGFRRERRDEERY